MRTTLLLITGALVLIHGYGTLWSKSDQKQTGKLTQNSRFGEPRATRVNINNISMWIRSDGLSANNPFNGDAGTIFPRQTSNIIFQDGLIWGGLVRDGQAPEIRVGGQTYGVGTVAGRILSPGVADDPTAPDVRIWRIRKDYATADLTLDAQELGLDVATVLSQYETDWREWPWEKGASWTGLDNLQDGGYLGADGVTILGGGNGVLDRGEDSNSNGILDAGEDANGNGVLDGEFPGIAGADQVVWTVANDLDSTTIISLYGSPPIGLEMQLTLWGYNASGPLSNVIFKRCRLIYKGTAVTPMNAVIDSMYVCQWSDPDVGNFGDDLVGCDTTLSLGYAYNASPMDDAYSTFGLLPPAAGYDLLQGPIVPSSGDVANFDFQQRPGFRNLPMTTFTFFGPPQTDSDPTRGANYNGTLQWWNLLRGFRPRPEYPPDPWLDPNGNRTYFRVPGDPVTGTGWIDSNPGERRLLLASGPFTMALGDTQEVVIALVAGLGESNLLSINELKNIDRSTQALFDNRFVHVLSSLDISAFYESATATRVFISANVAQPATTVEVTLTDPAGNVVDSVSLFDDGAHTDGAAGDGVFANELIVTPQQAPLNINVTVQTTFGTFEFEKFRKVTTAGPMVISALMVSSDNINSDGIINPGENIRVTASLHNGSAFDFSRISAVFNYKGPVDHGDEFDLSFSNVVAGATVTVNYDPRDPNTYTNFQVSQNAQDGDTIAVDITLFDINGNEWQDSKVLTIEAFSFVPEMQLVEHFGPGRGTFGIYIVNPAALTGHRYRITINNPTGWFEDRTLNLIDVTTGVTLLNEHPLPDEFSHNMPVTDGFKLTRGTLEFNFGFDQFVEVAFAGQPVEPPDNVWHSLNSNRSYLLSAGGGNGGLDRLSRGGANFANLGEKDLELRFTDSGSQGVWLFEGTRTTTGLVPFELWDIGIGTPDDPSDDVKLIPGLLTNSSANGTVGVFDVELNSFDPFSGRPITDWIYFYAGDYEAFENDAIDGNLDNFTISPESEYLARLVFVDFDQDGQIPPTGTTVRITTLKPPSQQDIYEFMTTITAIADENLQGPRSFALLQNYPNPFNPETSFRYEVPKISHITLEIFNILGQKLKTLVDEKQEPGKYTVIWDGTNELGVKVSSGLYIYRLRGEGFVKNRKMILLR
jgi:hypothetical protein